MKPIQVAEMDESTIVLSDDHKTQLATAMREAQSLLEKSAQMAWGPAWEPATETPEQKRSNERAERIRRLVESL